MSDSYNKPPKFLPENDGTDHINVYSKGKSKLGRMLSNFAHTPFTFGQVEYASVEAWWYYSNLKAMGIPESGLAALAKMHGYEAKKNGQMMIERLGVKPPPHKPDELLEIYRTKLDAHPQLRQMLLANTLPFDHYYVDAAGKRKDTFYAWTGLLWGKALIPVRPPKEKAEASAAVAVAHEQQAKRSEGKRTLFLDTETTGLYPEQGHRVIEIACVEAVDGKLTGGEYHIYLNPERPIDRSAQMIHGITEQFLRDKPLFYDIADEFIEYVRDAAIVIHNAPFDVGFLDSELAMAGRNGFKTYCGEVSDTLEMARSMHPGCPNKLDALCDRYRVDRSMRDKHGALVDTRILAAVFQELMMARRFEESNLAALVARSFGSGKIQHQRGADIHLKVITTNPEDLAAHNLILEGIQKESKGACLSWDEMRCA